MKKRSHNIVDTLAQASASLGIDSAILRYAKKNGCPAFLTGSRVNVKVLRKWINDHKSEIENQPALTKEQVQIKLGLKKLERETWAHERDMGKYYPKTEVQETMRQAAMQTRAVLQRKLETELPPILLGRDVIGITELMRQTVNEVCAIFHDRTRKWE